MPEYGGEGEVRRVQTCISLDPLLVRSLRYRSDEAVSEAIQDGV